MSSHTKPGWQGAGLGELDCGCAASSDGYDVSFCPTHAAAPELLEALEKAVTWEERRNELEQEQMQGVLDDWAERTVALQNEMRDARALIAQAKGEQHG